jgi:hypothetical protein
MADMDDELRMLWDDEDWTSEENQYVAQTYPQPRAGSIAALIPVQAEYLRVFGDILDNKFLMAVFTSYQPE